MILIAFVICAITTFIIFYSRIFLTLKYLAFSLISALFIVLFAQFYALLGTPFNGYPDDNFKYVHHELIDNDIYLWAYTNKNRLYIFEYNRETAEKLNEMAKNNKTGRFVGQSNREHLPGLYLDEFQHTQEGPVKQ